MQEERIRTKDQQISQLHRDIQDQKYSNDQIFHGVCGCFQRGKIAHSMAVCMNVCASIIFVYGTTEASRRLHYQTLERIVYAPMSWYDATPSGRTMSRYTADLQIIDFGVAFDQDNFFQTFASGIAALSVMTRRMHVLHASFTDMALNASFALNEASRRLGSNGPNKVWSLLEKKVQIVNCGAWNNLGDPVLGHNYATYKKAVEYYLEQLVPADHSS